MSTNKSKPGSTKTQAKIAQTTYIQGIIGSSKKTDVSVTKEAIDIVKSVYNWPDEDIIRVLQECHNDTQVALNRIADGTFKEPEQWNEVQTKTKKEHKETKPPRQQRQRDRTSSGQENETNGDKPRNQKPRENGDSEHRRQQGEGKGKKGTGSKREKGGNRGPKENGKSSQTKNESEDSKHTNENQPPSTENSAPKQEAPQQIQAQAPVVKQQQNQEPQLQKQEQKRPNESKTPAQQPKPATISYAQKLQQNLHQPQAKPYQPQDFPPVQLHESQQQHHHSQQTQQQQQQHIPVVPQSQPQQSQPQPSQSPSQPQQPQLSQTSTSANSTSPTSAPASNVSSSSIAQQQARTAYHPPENYVWKPKETTTTKESSKEQSAPTQQTPSQPVQQVQQSAPVHVQQSQPVVQKQETQQAPIQQPPQPVQPPVQSQPNQQSQARPNSFYSAPVILPPRSVQALDQTKINVQFGAFDDPRPVQSSQQNSIAQKPNTPPQFVQAQQLEHSSNIDQQAVDYSQQQQVDGHVSGIEQNFQVPPFSYIPGPHAFLPPFPQPYYNPDADPLRNPNLPVFDPNYVQPAFREPSPETSKFPGVQRTGSQNAPNADQFKQQGNFVQDVQNQNAQGTTQPAPQHPYGPYSAPPMYYPYINQYPYSIPSTSQSYGYPPKFFRPGYFPQPSANTNNVNFSAEELANPQAYQPYQPFFPFDMAMMSQQQQQQQQQQQPPKTNQPAQSVPANQPQKAQGYGQAVPSTPQQSTELGQGSNQPYKPQQFQGRDTFYNPLNTQPNQFAQQNTQASSFGYPNPYRTQFQ